MSPTFTLLLLFLVPCFCLYSGNNDVIELTDQNFQSLVSNSKDVWLVEFYAPWCGHCKSLTPEWIKAAKALKGFVKVGAVNMDVHTAVGTQLGVKGFPTIKRFDGKATPVAYNGERSARAIVEFGLQGVSSVISERLGGKPSSSSGGSGGSGGGSGDSDVVKLTASNFDELVLKSKDIWLVEFYAPWCGHCKKLAPAWADAAKKLKGTVKVGAVDATVEQQLGSRYNIAGYPTIKAFVPNQSPVDYQGPRDSPSIVSYGQQLAQQNSKPAEVLELVSEALFEEECKKKGLCIISFLPHILDSSAADRNKYITMLKSLAEKYKKNGFTWLWSEAASQLNLEEKLGVGGSGYPAVVALNAKKMVFSVMRRAFSEDGFNNFILGLTTGKESTSVLKVLPSISKVSAWDGKDGQLPK